MFVKITHVVCIFTIALHSCVFIGCDAGQILGLNKSNRIKGEYFVKLKPSEPDQIGLNAYSTRVVSALGTKGNYKNTYRIGKFEVIAISSDDIELVRSLADIPGVEYVEVNEKVQAFPSLTIKKDSTHIVPTGIDATHSPITSAAIQATTNAKVEMKTTNDHKITTSPQTTNNHQATNGPKTTYPSSTGDFVMTKTEAVINVTNHNKLTQTEETFVDPTCRMHSGDELSDGLWGHSRVNRRNILDSYSEKKYSYKYNESGEGVSVYVLDTGVNIEHTDFEDRAEYGYVSPGLREDIFDRNGHGTHVAGTVAGARYGLAKKANIISVKVLDRYGFGSLTDVLNGIQYAVDRYKNSGRRKSVCNLSLGIDAIVSILDDAVEAAVDEGIPFVVAAGNSAIDTCGVSPARAPKAITVGATNVNDELSWFSNWGDCVNILAPGSNIESASHQNDYGSVSFDGTSMACPHVAGAVARYLSSVPHTPPPDEVLTWLVSWATDGKIFMTQDKRQTPNKLLYIEPCEENGNGLPGYVYPIHENIPTEDPTQKTIPSEDSKRSRGNSVTFTTLMFLLEVVVLVL